MFSRSGSARVFLAVAAAIFALIFGVSAINSFSAPRIYVSKVRIKLVPIADNAGGRGSEPEATSGYDPLLMRTECEVLRSEVILAQVVNALGSNQRLGKRQHPTQERPGVPGRIAQLKKQIEVRPVPNTNVIAVCVLSEDPDQAARIANALGETYREYQGNLLKRVPPPMSSRLKAEVTNRALPASKPERLKTVLGVARGALGAILLGVAAGSVVVWIAFRIKPPMATDVLPRLFVIVFSAVLGTSALKSSVNLAVATAAGLLLAFVVGGVADWFVFLRKKYPETPNVFPAVFTTVILLVIGVGVISAAVSPGWYPSMTRLRLLLVKPDRARLGTALGGSTVCDPQLIKTQCDVICSEDILRPVIEDLDLNRQWGKRYNDGTPLQTWWTIESLKGRIDARRIPDTCLIEIRVLSEKAEEAARLADALGGTYRDHLRKRVAVSGQEPTPIEAEILDFAVPAVSPLPHSGLRQLIAYALAGLCAAFALGGVAAWNVAGLAKARNGFAQETSPGPV